MNYILTKLLKTWISKHHFGDCVSGLWLTPNLHFKQLPWWFQCSKSLGWGDRGVTDAPRNFTSELLELYLEEKKMPTEKVKNEQCGKKGCFPKSSKSQERSSSSAQQMPPGPLQTPLPPSSPAAPSKTSFTKTLLSYSHPTWPWTCRSPSP